MSLSDLSLLSISSQFRSLSLNKILENQGEESLNDSTPIDFIYHTTHKPKSFPVNVIDSIWEMDWYLIFPAVLSTDCLILDDSCDTEVINRLSNTA